MIEVTEIEKISSQNYYFFQKPWIQNGWEDSPIQCIIDMLD